MIRGAISCVLAMLAMFPGVCLAQNATQPTSTHQAASQLDAQPGKQVEMNVSDALQSSNPQEAGIVWAHFVSSAIKKHWTVPADAVPPHRVARVKLSFSANGTLEAYALTKSSLNFAYDDAAMAAVAAAQAKENFDPPPTNATFLFSIDFNSKEQPR